MTGASDTAGVNPRPESARRRRPARLVVAVTATMAACAAVALAVSSVYFPLTTRTLRLDAGAYLFSQRCASCHALTPTSAPRMGPNLKGIGAGSADRTAGLDPAAYVLQSILEPDAFIAPGASGRMPPGLGDDLNDELLRSLVGHVLSAGGGALDVERLLEAPIRRPPPRRRPPALLRQIRRGEHLFVRQLGCVACHGIHEDVGEALAAPSLANAGLLDDDYLERSIRQPGAEVVPGYRQVAVVLHDGATVTGRLWSRSAAAVSVLGAGADLDWRLHTIAVDDIAKLTESDTSTMPAYDLPVEQMVALLAFLRTLRADADGLVKY